MNDHVKGRSRAVPLSNANIDASDAIQGPKHTDHDDLDNGDDDDDGDDDDTRMQDKGGAGRCLSLMQILTHPWHLRPKIY